MTFPIDDNVWTMCRNLVFHIKVDGLYYFWQEERPDNQLDSYQNLVLC